MDWRATVGLKRQSACFASAKLLVQTPVPPKKKTKQLIN
jgi:hypothetical protein